MFAVKHLGSDGGKSAESPLGARSGERREVPASSRSNQFSTRFSKFSISFIPSFHTFPQVIERMLKS